MIILRVIPIYHFSLLEIKVPVIIINVIVLKKHKGGGENVYFTISSTPNSILHFSQSSSISFALMISNLRARRNLSTIKGRIQDNRHKIGPRSRGETKKNKNHIVNIIQTFQKAKKIGTSEASHHPFSPPQNDPPPSTPS